MEQTEIFPMNWETIPKAAALACQLWPEEEPEALCSSFGELLKKEVGAVFLAVIGGKTQGFAQCSLRRDYVEGTNFSPVGYLEGIYVLPEARGSGIGSMLLSACESWAVAQGCREFASDCELENVDSLRFHLALGFREANRVICFTKPLHR